jgi:hypothetical protein
MKRLMTNPVEILKVNFWEESVLNHGRMNQTTKRAIMVAAKV